MDLMEAMEILDIKEDMEQVTTDEIKEDLEKKRSKIK